MLHLQYSDKNLEDEIVQLKVEALTKGDDISFNRHFLWKSNQMLIRGEWEISMFWPVMEVTRLVALQGIVFVFNIKTMNGFTHNKNGVGLMAYWIPGRFVSNDIQSSTNITKDDRCSSIKIFKDKYHFIKTLCKTIPAKSKFKPEMKSIVFSWNQTWKQCKDRGLHLLEFLTKDDLTQFVSILKTSTDLFGMEAIFIGLTTTKYFRYLIHIILLTYNYFLL